MQSVKAAHNQYTSLLHRFGRCLSFGCGPAQMKEAVSLAQPITRSWPAAYLVKDRYYMSLGRRCKVTDSKTLESAVLGLSKKGSKDILHWMIGRDTKLEVQLEDRMRQPFRVRSPAPPRPSHQTHLLFPDRQRREKRGIKES